MFNIFVLKLEINNKPKNSIHIIKNNLFNTLLKFTIIFFHFSFVLTEETKKILYIKTNGIINEMKIIKSSNHILNILSETDIVIDNDNNIYMKEIEAEYGGQIITKLLKNEIDISVGILLQIGNDFYKIEDSNFTVLFNEEKNCEGSTDIKINETYTTNISYCHISNKNEVTINISIPSINYCYKTCLKCNEAGDENNHNCLECDNNKGYYLKEGSNNCYNYNSIVKGIYFDDQNSIFKNCNEACFTCNGPYNDNCTSCDNTTYFFKEDVYNICYRSNTIEHNYFLDSENQIFKRCYESCFTCNGPNFDNCLSCDHITYFFKQNEDNNVCFNKNIMHYYVDYNDGLLKKCDETCLTCDGPYAQNCISCDNITYFFKEDDHNCYSNVSIDHNYYLDVNNLIFKKCNEACYSCNGPHDSNCISCNNITHFNKEDGDNRICYNENIAYYYLDKNENLLKKCNEACLKCNGPYNYNCISCDNTTYFFKENENNNICYEKNLLHHYVDEKDHLLKECKETCLTCKGPNNNDCTSCDNTTYFFKENDANTCYSTETIEKSYYLDSVDKLFKSCSINCLTCIGPNPYDCSSCDNITFYNKYDDGHIFTCYNKNSTVEKYYFDSSSKSFKNCHSTCLTCSGKKYYHCLSCDNNIYFFKEDVNNVCYKFNKIGDRYYFDNNSSIFRKCHETCLSCNGPYYNNCTSCDNTEYFFKEKGDNNECYKKDIEHYYLDDKLLKECHETCLTCYGPYDDNCISCDEITYFFKEDNNNNICYSNLSIDINYYLDSKDKKFKKCDENCLSCYGPSNTNCLSCKENYYFKEDRDNDQCFSNTPSHYFLDTTEKLFKRCDISCSSCDGPNFNDCTSCDGNNYFEVQNFPRVCLDLSSIPENYFKNDSGYYQCKWRCKTCIDKFDKCTSCNNALELYLYEPKYYCATKGQIPNNFYFYTDFDKNEIKIEKCSSNCSTCSKGYNKTTNEMNCDSCKDGYYFQNETSTNCILRPETGYYIDLSVRNGTLFPCHRNCLTCEKKGNDTHNECIECFDKSSYFDDIYTTTCVKDNNECNKYVKGCAKCYNETDHPLYGQLSDLYRCKRCSHLSGYFPLQKSSVDQFYVHCYNKSETPKNYLLIGDEFKLCHQTCEYCSEIGNYTHHKCISCDTNYQLVEEEPGNCLPKCVHYYFYSRYGQYKCTEEKECPEEFPLLVPDKLKCTDKCDNYDNMYLYNGKCLKTCPEGTIYIDSPDGIQSPFICGESNSTEINCTLDDYKNHPLEPKDITKDILENYAKNYIENYPVSLSHVTSYTPPKNSKNQYLLVIYKYEKCPKEKVNNFEPLNFTECLKNIKEKKGFSSNKYIVIEIFYTFNENSKRIKFNFYDPDTKEKLDTSECKLKNVYTKSIYECEEVDSELAKEFAQKGINILDINDPYFNDICSVYKEGGKDLTLKDRIALYYQNVTLCDDGCVSISIDIKAFEVECSCDIINSETDSNNLLADTLLANPLSSEVMGIIEEINIAVLKCITKAFEVDNILKNFGGLSMAGISFLQIIISISIRFQIKQVRKYIYSLINELNSPPKRRENKDKKSTNEKDDNKNDIVVYNKKIKETDEKKNKTDKNYSNQIIKTQEKKKEPKLKIDKNKNDKTNENDVSSARVLTKGKNNINKKELNLNKVLDISINENEFEREVKIGSIKTLKQNMKKEIISKLKREQREKKLDKKERKSLYVSHEKKEYDENEINDLDFDDAVRHDKRNCCQMFWYTLKQRQMIINTFFAIDQLKPFSIKLLVMIFTFTCYFVINAFFYNEDYISNELNAEGQSLLEYLLASSERIIYTFFVGGLISVVVGILFSTDKKIEDAKEKYEKNKILLKGEISRIYKCNNVIIIVFTIFQFIVMTIFTIYIFCFCYVYPNSTISWVKSSLIIIGIIESVSILTSSLISFIKFLSVKFNWELCYKINIYLEENL